MGENHFASAPTALYGVVLLMAAIAYYILLRAILRKQGPTSLLAVPAAFVRPWIAGALYVAVALMWLVPDPRIERRLSK